MSWSELGWEPVANLPEPKVQSSPLISAKTLEQTPFPPETSFEMFATVFFISLAIFACVLAAIFGAANWGYNCLGSILLAGGLVSLFVFLAHRRDNIWSTRWRAYHNWLERERRNYYNSLSLDQRVTLCWATGYALDELARIDPALAEKKRQDEQWKQMRLENALEHAEREARRIKENKADELWKAGTSHREFPFDLRNTSAYDAAKRGEQWPGRETWGGSDYT